MKFSERLKVIILAALLTVSAGNCFASSAEEKDTLASRSVEELETMRVKNNVKLESLQRGIEKARKEYESTSHTEKAKKEYYSKLSEKIDLENQNIECLVRQINMLESEVADTNEMVLDIEYEISEYRTEADETLENFKQRLRAAYMAEGDNLSSVLIGSSSFFDILSKSEMVSRISKRDRDMLDSLDKKLTMLHELDDQLVFKQEVISGNLDEASAKKSELDEKLEVMKKEYDEIKTELDKLSGDRKNFKKDFDTKSAALEEQQKEQEKIAEAIKKAREREKKEMEELEEKAKKEKYLNKGNTGYTVNRGTSGSSGSSGSSGISIPAGSTQINVPVTATDMLWPVPGYTSHSSFYGYREFDNSNHKAIDIQGNPNDTIEFAKIYAAESGKVITATNYCTHSYGKSYSCGCGGGYGNYIVLQHEDGVYQTVYAHCYTIYVSEGDTVRKGQLIGLVGSTGYSTGPHLHFEVRKNGEKTNPDSYTYINYG